MKDIEVAVLMVIVSFVIGYFTMTAINTKNVTCNLNKVYGATLMALLMGVYEIYMMNGSKHTSRRDDGSFGPVIIILTLLIASIIVFYLIRNQTFINDKQFYLAMIEHHQMALEMAGKIKEKTKDPELQTLASNILKSQQSEIDFMWRKVENSSSGLN